MASTYLQRTPSNNYYTEATFSFWFKRSGLSSDIGLFGRKGTNQTAYGTFCHFGGDDTLLINFRDSGGTSQYYMITNRKFRDTSAWYHIHLIIDGNNATQGDRSRLYINGVRETDFALLNNPSSTGFAISTFLTTGEDLTVGRSLRSQTNTFHNLDGSMTHFHCVTGTAYEPTVFGETDATTGIWKPITAPSVTYGTDGFFLKFENSGAFGTDSSGNSNNFTVNGTMTQTIDTPSNVFATWNPLAGFALPNGGFSNGNTTATQGGNTSWTGAISNLGVNSGKYYCEIKWTTTGQYSLFGFIPSSEIDHLGALGQTGNTHYGLYYSGDLFVLENGSTSSVSSFSSTISSGDIVQLALDKDNNKMYWGINGTWQNSANPSAGTGGYSIGYLTDEYWHFAINQRTDSGNGTMQINFGNGYFGTTAVSSAQNPDDGIGIFEFSPPTGYKSLCTKSINSQEYD